MKTLHRIWIIGAAAIAFVGALAHIVAVLGGSVWYAFFRAPPVIVASAEAGTWLAPLAALGIAALMALCSAYALSATGLVRRLPFSRMATAAIAFLCLARAILIIPVVIKRPDLVDTFEIVATIMWGLAGVGYALAFIALRPNYAFKRTAGRGFDVF